MASTRPGWPASRTASASVEKIATSRRTGWRGRALPTTVTERVLSVDASASRAPSLEWYPVTTSPGRVGARPAVST